MNIKEYLSKNLYRTFFSLCAVLLFTSAALRQAGINSPVAVVIASLLFTVLNALAFSTKRKITAFIGIAAAAASILLSMAIAKIDVIELGARIADKLASDEELSVGELILICSAAAIIVSVLFFALSKLKPARFLIAAAASALLIFYGISSISADFAELFGGTGMIICVLSELHMSSKYKKDTSGDTNQVISFLLPAFAVFSVVVAVIPSQSEPIRWTAVKTAIDKLASAASGITSEISFLFSPESSEFSISMIGYSEKFGGFSSNNIPSDRLEFIADFSTSFRSSPYLIGSVSDVYDGRKWDKSKYPDFGENDFFLDYCETMSAIERSGLSKEEQYPFIKNTSLEIDCDRIKTRTLFYPLKASSITQKSDDKFSCSEPSIKLDRICSDDTKYKLSYMDIDYHSEEFITIATTPFSYADNSDYSYQSIPRNIPEILKKRADYIKQQYTVLPDSITPRTYELAHSITAGCATDFDRLKAIEAYLNINYSYTLTPGEIPSGYEPVDYFLFESKCGYCTYFASAMAVLARCENIPTRYVNGFYVDTSRKTPNQRYKYNVLRSEAHAWTEAYLEGIGWVPFEPTASLSTFRYNYLREMFPTGSMSYKPNIPEYHPMPNTAPVVLPETPAEKKLDTRILTVILVSLLSIILIPLCYIAIRLRIFILNYGKYNDTDKFLICYKMISYVCSKKRLIRDDGETASSFAFKVAQTYQSDKVSFIDITHAFDRIRYGSDCATQAERSDIEHFLTIIFDSVRSRGSKLETVVLFVGYCFSSD